MNDENENKPMFKNNEWYYDTWTNGGTTMKGCHEKYLTKYKDTLTNQTMSTPIQTETGQSPF